MVVILISYLEYKNHLIYYEWLSSSKAPKNNVLIFIHGLGLDHNSWTSIIPLLQENYHVLIYDLQGHGQSSYSEEEALIYSMTQDLYYLVTNLNIDSFHLIAQGFGGMIAIEYTYQFPKKVLSLSLLAVPVYYPKDLAVKQVNFRKTIIQNTNSLQELGEMLLPKICYQITSFKKDILLNAYKKVNKDVYLKIFHDGLLKTIQVHLQRIDKPILLLTGSEDSVYPPELFSATLKVVPHARYLTVPDASFMIQLDQPNIVVKWLHQFIQQKSALSLPQDKADYLTELSNELERHLKSQSIVRHEINVSCMKRFSVSINGNEIVNGWGKRKAKVIFVYLCLQKSVTRDELCDTFWPSLPLDKAKNQLRVSLHHLKKILHHDQTQPEPILVAEREHVVINGKIGIDYLHYKNKLETSLSIQDLVGKIHALEECLEQASSNFFPGFYEDYYQNIRLQLERVWTDVSHILANYYKSIGVKEKEKKYNQFMEHL